MYVLHDLKITSCSITLLIGLCTAQCDSGATKVYLSILATVSPFNYSWTVYGPDSLTSPSPWHSWDSSVSLSVVYYLYLEHYSTSQLIFCVTFLPWPLWSLQCIVLFLGTVYIPFLLCSPTHSGLIVGSACGIISTLIPFGNGPWQDSYILYVPSMSWCAFSGCVMDIVYTSHILLIHSLLQEPLI